MESGVFVKMAEEEQKIKFQEMASEEEVVKLTMDCFYKN